MVTSRCAAIFQQIQTSVWWWGCGDRQQYIQECVWRASQSQGWWHCDINGKNVIKNCRMSTAAFNLRIYGAVSWLLMRFQDLMMYCEAWVMWKQQKSHQFCSYWGPLSEDHIQRWLKAELKKKKGNLCCSYWTSFTPSAQICSSKCFHLLYSASALTAT